MERHINVVAALQIGYSILGLMFAGAFFALILTMIKAPALAFALGMYLPLELNTPLLAGGIISVAVESNRWFPSFYKIKLRKIDGFRYE